MIIGKADIYYECDGVYLGNFEIYEQYRGKGYGNAFLNNVIQLCGVNTLVVAQNNIKALSLYTKHGFKIIQSYYASGLGMDVHFMKLEKTRLNIIDIIKFLTDGRRTGLTLIVSKDRTSLVNIQHMASIYVANDYSVKANMNGNTSMIKLGTYGSYQAAECAFQRLVSVLKDETVLCYMPTDKDMDAILSTKREVIARINGKTSILGEMGTIYGRTLRGYECYGKDDGKRGTVARST